MTEDLYQERIEGLKAALQPVGPHDSVAAAGRKLLLADFIRMLEREPGARSGEDIEDVHQMRVAIRRMRSALRLLRPYYRNKKIAPFRQHLQQVARALGAVRDLDVLIEHLQEYRAGLAETEQAVLDDVMALLDARRQKGRAAFVRLVDSKAHRRFEDAFAAFVSPAPSEEASQYDGDVTPHQVRHLVPVLLHQRLAVVRAYDSIMAMATPEALHALRVEVKRLRYAVWFFRDVLGNQARSFIQELKNMQDYLGALNDSVVAQEVLADLPKLKKNRAAVVQAYLATLDEHVDERMAGFPQHWEHFNKRAVQRLLSDSLLVLR